MLMVRFVPNRFFQYGSPDSSHKYPDKDTCHNISAGQIIPGKQKANKPAKYGIKYNRPGKSEREQNFCNRFHGTLLYQTTITPFNTKEPTSGKVYMQ